MCTHLRFQRDGENRAGGDVSYPGVFQAEFLVYGAEEVLDGEIADSFQGHCDGRARRV